MNCSCVAFLEIPVGELDKPTDRDRRSWVFLSYPKKYFATQKLLSEKQNSKNTPPPPQKKNTVHLAKVKHDMIIMENRDH